MFKEFDKIMGYELTIIRKDGTKTIYDFKSRTKLSEVDEKREIITLFDNGQCFHGYCDGIGIQKMLINESVSYPLISPRMSSTPVSWIKLAFYDGLSLEDWKDWFRNYKLSKPLAIIHFTNFRY